MLKNKSSLVFITIQKTTCAFFSRAAAARTFEPRRRIVAI